jgi:NAD+ diphosphatase
MLGFIAEAASTEIDTSLDKELESASWFTRSEVVAALNKEPNAVFAMAPEGALAHTLIHSWVHDKRWQNSNSNAKM